MKTLPIKMTSCGPIQFMWGKKTYVMGIINVTPDSFSGDGICGEVDLATELANQMEISGADIIDVGGESTRRNNNKVTAIPISAEEELSRIIPVIQRLTKVLSIPISVDTYKPEVAEKCLDAGAHMINNIRGIDFNSEMFKVVAQAGVPIVIMHNKTGHQYSDLIKDIIVSLKLAIESALDAGILRHNIIVDPGIGFGKIAEQNLEIERRLDEFQVLGHPIMMGTSRKSHIGMVLGGLSVEERMEGTAATVACNISKGVDMVRVHDVKQMVRVARMSDAIVRGWRQ